MGEQCSVTALLDTHILIWWLNQSSQLSSAQKEVLAAADADSPLLVSDISLWEAATLYTLGAASRSRFRCECGSTKRSRRPWYADRASPRSWQQSWRFYPIPSTETRQTEFSSQQPGYWAQRF